MQATLLSCDEALEKGRMRPVVQVVGRSCREEKERITVPDPDRIVAEG